MRPILVLPAVVVPLAVAAVLMAGRQVAASTQSLLAELRSWQHARREVLALADDLAVVRARARRLGTRR